MRQDDKVGVLMLRNIKTYKKDNYPIQRYHVVQPPVSFLGICSRKKRTYYQKISHIESLIATLLISTKVYIIQYLSTTERKHLWCIQKMEWYAAVERNKLQLHKIILMNITRVMLSLTNKTKKNT